MNSQKVQCVTKLHARDLLSFSLRLLQPKRETAEGTTKNSNEPANIKSVDTRHGVNNKDEYVFKTPQKFPSFFWVDITRQTHHSL